MNKAEKEVMKYLENSYSGARIMGDESCQIRLARAIVAFSSDPSENPSDLFTEKFMNKYWIGLSS
mgnify:FL=1|jgi:hypothetical protein